MNDMPEWTENRLLILRHKIAPHEKHGEIPIAPQVSQMQIEPSGLWLNDQIPLFSEWSRGFTHRKCELLTQNCGIWSRRDFRVRRYRLQTPHREVFDAALVRHGGKKQTHVRSAVWPSEKPNMTKEVGNVMDEPGHTSELHV